MLGPRNSRKTLTAARVPIAVTTRFPVSGYLIPMTAGIPMPPQHDNVTAVLAYYGV